MSELSSVDKLVQIDESTTDSGLVRVEITEWEEDGDHVIVTFATPTGDLKTERMLFPEPGDSLEQNKFYRIIQSCDLSMRNADMLVGETVLASKKNDQWTIEVQQEIPVIERMLQSIATINFPSLKWIISIAYIVSMLCVVLSLAFIGIGAIL